MCIIVLHFRGLLLITMAFWQENYQFIKEVYDMRLSRMSEWMDNVDKAIGRIMADKVYTSAEFKRERDTFHVRAMLFPRINLYYVVF